MTSILKINKITDITGSAENCEIVQEEKLSTFLVKKNLSQPLSVKISFA